MIGATVIALRILAALYFSFRLGGKKDSPSIEVKMNFFESVENFSNIKFIVGNRYALINFYRLDEDGEMILKSLDARLGCKTWVFQFSELPRDVLYLVSNSGEIREVSASWEMFEGGWNYVDEPCRCL